MQWLDYSNEKSLTEQLKGVESVEEAPTQIARYSESESAPRAGESAPSRKSHSRKDSSPTQ